MRDAGDHHDVGSLGDETAKLLGALSGWARDHAGEAGESLSGIAAQAAAAAHELNEHMDTGTVECTVCPICRTVHAVRHVSPEVRAHLASAATSLAHAASAFLASEPQARRRYDVERIDLSDEWPDADPE